MADAYGTIARLGSRVPLRTIRFVTDDRGKVLSAGDTVQPVQVFPARDVYILTSLMKGVIDRGTAAAARSMGFRKIAAGKTGTTNDKRDAWFIGFTPQTLAVTWVGFDDNSPIGLAGGEAAVPIWTRYMQAVAAGQPNADWPAPSGITFTAMDETSGGVGTPLCPEKVVVSQPFKSGTEPTVPCPLHSPQSVPTALTVDQFGNPIALDTAATSTEGLAGATSTEPMTPPDSTLTGGVFRNETAPPPAAPPPPATTTHELRPTEPPPATNTSMPQTSTTTSPPP
jgi:membrane carboxypeptidase/penicillin-binding protein